MRPPSPRNAHVFRREEQPPFPASTTRGEEIDESSSGRRDPSVGSGIGPAIPDDEDEEYVTGEVLAERRRAAQIAVATGGEAFEGLKLLERRGGAVQ